jgi:hypothetical protein
VESSVEKKPEPDADLALVTGQFEDFCAATVSMRALAKKCRDYKDGNQWTPDERKTLEKRKQPCITDNKIQDKVDTLMGLEKQQRTDPKAYPRNPGDEGAAEAATDALRYVADACDYQKTARKPMVENLIVEGWCYAEIYLDKKSKDRNICAEHIRVDRGYHDVRSLRPDFADKEYAGYFTWMDADVVKRMWKAAATVVDGSFVEGTVPGTDTEHEDKPNRYTEVNGNRKRLQVFTHYHKKDGVWMFSRWCKGGFLEAPQPSIYKDKDGQPDCNIEVQALYRDSEGACYGRVQRDLDQQDEHNKRRSKLLHLLNTKRVVTRKGALGQNINKARAELHKPDGVLEVEGSIDEVRVEDNLDLAQGQFQLLQYTDAQLAQTGPNGALMGQSGQISGRAKELDQASGSLPLLPVFDAIDGIEIRIYRKMWLCIRQFWTDETWIRVTDDERKLKFVALNQPETHGDRAAEQLKTADMPEEQKRAALEQIAQDPQMRQPIIGPDNKPVRRNDVAKMDIDIIISRSADTVNIQAEQFEIIAGLAEKRPEVPFSVIIEASQLRADMKRRILDALPGGGDPAAQQAQAAMQQVQAAAEEVKGMQAEAEQAQAAAKAEQAQVAVDRAQLEVAAAGIETDRANLAKERAEFDAHVAQTAGAQAEDGAKQATEAVQAESQALVEEVRGELAAVVQNLQQQSEALLQQAEQQLQAIPQIVAQASEQQAAAKPQRVDQRLSVKRAKGGKLRATVTETMSDGSTRERIGDFQRGANGLEGVINSGSGLMQ